MESRHPTSYLMWVLPWVWLSPAEHKAESVKNSVAWLAMSQLHSLGKTILHSCPVCSHRVAPCASSPFEIWVARFLTGSGAMFDKSWFISSKVFREKGYGQRWSKLMSMQVKCYVSTRISVVLRLWRQKSRTCQKWKFCRIKPVPYLPGLLPQAKPLDETAHLHQLNQIQLNCKLFEGPRYWTTSIVVQLHQSSGSLFSPVFTCLWEHWYRRHITEPCLKTFMPMRRPKLGWTYTDVRHCSTSTRLRDWEIDWEILRANIMVKICLVFKKNFQAWNNAGKASHTFTPSAS